MYIQRTVLHDMYVYNEGVFIEDYIYTSEDDEELFTHIWNETYVYNEENIYMYLRMRV